MNSIISLTLCFSLSALCMQQSVSTHVIDALNCNISGYNPVLTVMTYNVDNAVREEKFESTQWKNRAPRVTQLITDAQTDIVCLQELRELTMTPKTPTVNEFLAGFKNYRHEKAYRGPSELSFGQATLYNPKKLFAVKSFPLWLSDTPEEVSDTWTAKRDAAWGYIVLCTKFRLVEQGKIVKNAVPFWVFNTHFGLDEDIKTKSCHKILQMVRKKAKANPFILCGDFNFFPDKDCDKQRGILTSETKTNGLVISGMKDLGKGARTLTGKELEGTFVGYDHDEFKADLKKMVSRLDHILGSETVEKVGDATLYTKTMLENEPEELTTRNYPSDHLPLMVKLKLYPESVQN